MICAMTARRIAPGRTDDFLEAFSGGAGSMPPEIRERFAAICACRDVKDPNTILTFGMFDGTLDELRELQGGGERSDQLQKMEPFVEEVLIDGSFEVLHDFISESAGSGAGATPFKRFAPATH